jgi:hypothetical protein
LGPRVGLLGGVVDLSVGLCERNLGHWEHALKGECGTQIFSFLSLFLGW